MKKLILASLLAMSSVANASYYSGNQLFNKMTSADTVDKMFALGYIAGVHDAMEGVAVCAPQGVTLGQLSDVVLKKLRSIPEHRHNSADSLVFMALSEAFPCKNKKKSNL